MSPAKWRPSYPASTCQSTPAYFQYFFHPNLFKHYSSMSHWNIYKEFSAKLEVGLQFIVIISGIHLVIDNEVTGPILPTVCEIIIIISVWWKYFVPNLTVIIQFSHSFVHALTVQLSVHYQQHVSWYGLKHDDSYFQWDRFLACK